MKKVKDAFVTDLEQAGLKEIDLEQVDLKAADVEQAELKPLQHTEDGLKDLIATHDVKTSDNRAEPAATDGIYKNQTETVAMAEDVIKTTTEPTDSVQSNKLFDLTGETLLQVSGLTKRYRARRGSNSKDFFALKDLSFSVRGGEVVGFLGPNGSGKSTAIKLITGLASITSGSVAIMGNDIEKSTAKALRFVGGVIEQPDIYPNMTAVQAMRYYASFYPRETFTDDLEDPHTTKELIEMRVEKLLSMVGLSGRKNDLVKKYSLGMKQRLGIAQALLNRPRLLILDEPANGLDPAGIRKIRDIIVSLARDMGMGILVSSHQLSEMQLMCDRVIILSRGAKIAEGTVDELLNRIGKRRILVKTAEPQKVRQLFASATDIGLVEIPGGIAVTGNITAGDVAKKMVLEQIDMQGVSEEGGSLEDLFMNLTEGGSEE